MPKEEGKGKLERREVEGNEKSRNLRKVKEEGA
jgi:hypothetical protein